MLQWGISVQTLSNADLIVSGSIHQADRRFSDVSRGRQCAFTSLLTLLRANTAVFRIGRPTKSVRY